ncbi:MAG: sigma 54-interacting transcriptional regulator [Thermodesulfobacteriota bacterium]
MQQDTPTALLDPGRRLSLLRQRLTQVMHAWSIEDYRGFVQLFVRLLPGVLEAERCTIFIMEPGTERICSIYGTGIAERAIKPPRKGSVVGEVIANGRSVIANHLAPEEKHRAQVEAQTGFVTRNLACAPIRSRTGHGVAGAIQVLNKTGDQGFEKSDLALLEEVADYLSISIESIILNQEILRISEQVGQEVDQLGLGSLRQSRLVAESEPMREILAMVKQISTAPVNVLLLGENGTGKELIARLIHEWSDRRDRPFVAVNCAAIPGNLAESEFFGYEKGAFTGADHARGGHFEEAHGGSLFLDEIADMPLAIQPKFLRALQEGEGSRLGGGKPRRYDLRIISATNQDLLAAKEGGKFREDLYFRLFAVEIRIPPLRERREDIVPLALSFLEQTSKRFHRRTAGFSREVLTCFEQYPWPGNVRQLQREVERLVALTPDGEPIQLATCSVEVRQALSGQPPADHAAGSLVLPTAVRNLESTLIRQAFKQSEGRMGLAAELLQITRQGLRKKMKRYGL